MDLNTITEIAHPRARAALPAFRVGDAYLAGGTWLFSEPQTHLRRLIDLGGLAWPALTQTDTGLHIAATCTLASLESYEAPAHWPAAKVIAQSCRALLGSFKICRIATVGGNLCLALPASPMAALAVALGGICTVWRRDGGQRDVQASALITGAQRTILRDGEILRSIWLPDAMLRRRAAFRQISLTPMGRSAALLIGISDGRQLELTITASVARPIRLTFDHAPDADGLARAIDAAVPEWFADVHGKPEWRRRITHLMAADIFAELAS